MPEAAPGDEEAEGRIVRPVLDAIAQRAPQAAMSCSRRPGTEVDRIEAFCRERNIIGLPDEPLQITWTPVFMRAYGRAFLDSPGPARPRPAQPVLDHAAGRVAGRGGHRVVPARGQRPDGQADVHPRGHPRPLPPARLVEPLELADPHDLPERHVRRGLGGLRDAGHDGPRLRRRRPGADAQPLEVLPARRHQRHPRRGDPRRGHDRAGGHGPDGRRRLPGAGRGSRQVAAGTDHLDPALHVLPRLAGDVGPGGRGAPPRRQGRRRRRGRGARAAHRGRPGRDARLRLPPPPRIGHLARHAADQVGAAHPAPKRRRPGRRSQPRERGPDARAADALRAGASAVPARRQPGRHRRRDRGLRAAGLGLGLDDGPRAAGPVAARRRLRGAVRGPCHASPTWPAARRASGSAPA